MIEGLIAGDSENITFQIVYLVENIPAKPELDKYFLGDLFSDVVRMGDCQYISV